MAIYSGHTARIMTENEHRPDGSSPSGLAAPARDSRIHPILTASRQTTPPLVGLSLCLAAHMGWATREIGIASGVGATVAAVEGMRAHLGGLTLVALVVGVFVGVVVGSVSVVGGYLAVRSAQVWPPRSARCWRHRFATCSAAAVFLLVAMFFMWGASTSAVPGSIYSSGGAWFLGISAACAAVTYVCTVFLAPAADPSALR